MAKGNSKLSGTHNLYRGLYVEGKAYNQARADEIVKATKDVLLSFGLGNEVRSVSFVPLGKDGAAASMNGQGHLSISNKYLEEGLTASNGWNTSNSYYGTGAHEAGHAVVNGLLKSKVSINGSNAGKATNFERAIARKKGKLENEIIKEAKKRYGSNPKISGYGSKNNVEKVAEAVSDVYSNKGKAHAYSKAIVGVMRDINTGRFKPKIKLSKSEMKI